MLFYASWGEGIDVQQTDMEILNEDRYTEFLKQETKCHSDNLQSGLDLMKEADVKQRKQLESYTRKTCKEYNVANAVRWRNPIVWKAMWNYKET